MHQGSMEDLLWICAYERHGVESLWLIPWRLLMTISGRRIGKLMWRHLPPLSKLHPLQSVSPPSLSHHVSYARRRKIGWIASYFCNSIPEYSNVEKVQSVTGFFWSRKIGGYCFWDLFWYWIHGYLCWNWSPRRRILVFWVSTEPLLLTGYLLSWCKLFLPCVLIPFGLLEFIQRKKNSCFLGLVEEEVDQD